MNRQTSTLLLSLLLICSTASASSSTIPDLSPSWATSATGAICVSPAGTGPTLASQGLTVTIAVIDFGNVPIPGYPFQDMYLYDDGTAELSVCNGGSVADANTDANGMSSFSGALSMGGSTQNGLRAYIAGIPVDGPTGSVPENFSLLSIDIVSPDTNGDLRVDLIDVGAFVTAYNSGGYVFTADMNPDGVLDISDVGVFAEHLGDECP